MKSNPISGAGYLIEGMRLIFRRGVRLYVLIPLLINITLFSLLIVYGAGQFNALMEWILPAWLDWLEWLLWPLFGLTVLIVVFYTFILFANLICAPFNGFLAAAVERNLTGRTREGGKGGMAGEVLSAIQSEFKKLGYLATRSAALLVLFLIPGVNILAPILWTAFGAWMLAVEFTDYPMGNRGLIFSDLRILLKEKRLLVLGFGGAVLLLTIVPVLNFIAVPAAVAGATAMCVREFPGG